ncbi:MAG: hypothetical protein C5S40_05485 [ANME-2 cluster archaeon]|nr:hypothetical protein [ANME-2 cluster archaeon]
MKRVRESGLSRPGIAVNYILKFKLISKLGGNYEKNSEWFVYVLFDIDDACGLHPACIGTNLRLRYVRQRDRLV